MSIGGVDVLLLAPAAQSLGDIILRVCRWHWPEGRCIFQEVEEIPWYPLDNGRVWQVGVRSRDFFVYKDEEAVAAWADGPTRSNVNTMLHFIIGDPLPDRPQIVEVALVCDRITPDVRRLGDDLSRRFAELIDVTTLKEAA